MASRRFFANEPYDYYYTAPYHHYAYPYYHQQQPSAPARRASGFFPVAADAEPAAARRPAVNPAPRAASRSVLIPVHFVGSDPQPEREQKAPQDRAQPVATMAPGPSAEAAAFRLQAATRGFLARKSVRAVRDVEREAGEVQRKVEREAKALRGDARARIAAGEALMRLLLRLDAVRGAREYRRRVTKRVLALQDAVDALEPMAAPAPDAVEKAAEADEAEHVVVEMAEESAVATRLPDAADHIAAENEAKAADEAADEMEVDGDKGDGERGAAEGTEQTAGATNLDAAGETEGPAAGSDGECEMVTAEHAAPASCQELESSRTADAAVAADGVDARKVMEMVAALCERSAQQCEVIGVLAERVDALERAVRRVEDAERRRRRAKKLRKEGKGSNRSKCYTD